jgi:hypothetical protein
MLWLVLLVILLPALIMAMMNIGRRSKPGYSGNGDIYEDLPERYTNLER